MISTIQNYGNSVNYGVIRDINSGIKYLLTLTSVFIKTRTLFMKGE